MPGIFDVSLILNENIPIYPGDPEFKIENVTSFEKEGYITSKICLGSHTGTHIDAPSHFFETRIQASELSLDTLIGKCIVFEFTNDEAITAGDLDSLDFEDHTRIIFKTKNSNFINMGRFVEDYAYLEKDAAEYLVKKGIRLIGFDYYTIDKYNSEMPAHRKLLENDILVIEGLNLANVDPGEYELIALPIKLKADGAPARVVLRQFIVGNIP